MVRQLHDRVKAQDAVNRAVSEAFAVTNGARQGCVLASTLFGFEFSVIPMEPTVMAYPIRIAYRPDGHLNSQCIQAPTRLSMTTVHDLLLTKDCALKTKTEEGMLKSLDCSASDHVHFELAISMDKTAAICQQPPNAAYNIPCIHVNGTQPETVDNFAYLGSTLSRCIKVDDEVVHWVSIVSQVFTRPRKTLTTVLSAGL
nr:unnamed protein product [Spirometra erinaceieuropaei]